MRFEEKCATHNVQNGYTSTNEEPELFRRLLGVKRFNRAASICSGGEIPMMVLLPRSKEVVAIDHSYVALAACWIKAKILEDLGANKMREDLIDERYDNLNAVMAKVKDTIPAELKAHINMNSYTLGEMRKEVFHNRIHPRTLRKLDNLTLVHGDLTDLTQYGQFDILYISNAMEHQNRFKKNPALQDFLPLVKDEGLLLASGYSAFSKSGAKVLNGWEHLRTIRGIRTGWNHSLLKKVPQEKVATP